MSTSDWLWTVFWVTAAVAFIVTDTVLATNDTPGDTATERIRAGMKRWRWFRLLVVVFLAWLAVHLLWPAGFV